MKKLMTYGLSALLLSSCSVGDVFKPVEIKLPEQWKNTDNKAPVSPAWPAPDWWNGFQSPRLNTFIAQAQTANFDLRAAIARVREADAQAQVAGAALLPTVSAKASVERTYFKAGGKYRGSNAISVGPSASYELDFWGKNRAAAQSAEAQADASRFDQQVVALTMVSDVATTYFTIVSLQDRLQIIQANLADQENLLGNIRKRFEQGLVSGLDVAQQENLVASQRAILPDLKQQLQQNVSAFALLLGELPENLKVPTDQDKNIGAIALPAVPAGLPSELLLRRPDVQEAEANLIAANADITVARAQFFPSIGLTADAGSQSALFSNLFKTGSFVYSFGASLAQPIFTGGSLTGQLEFSKARYDELVENYKKAVASAFGDVENALSGVTQTVLKEQAQAVAEKAAQDAYGFSQRQFKEGTIDILTLLDTQRSLFSAQDAHVQAKLAHLQAIVNLYIALGGGWQADSAPEAKSQVKK